MKTLIVETQSNGHYPEYLKHVISWVNENNLQDEYVFYLTGNLESHLTEFQDLPVKTSICFFDKSKDDELRWTNDLAGFIVNRIKEINLKFEIKVVVFLNINLVLRFPGILFSSKKFPYLFKGIFFQSPYRLRIEKTGFLKRIKREAAIFLLAKNKNCKDLFLLNDPKGADYYSKWSKKIKNINDPIHVIENECINIREKHGISAEKKVVLHIGSLSEIKGTLDVIETLININGSNRSQEFYFLLVGKSTEVVTKKMALIENIVPHSNYHFRNEYVEDCEFISYIKQSDIVLITNNNVETSSGILNHAVFNSKMILAPNKGYFLERLSNYEFSALYSNKNEILELIVNSVRLVNEADSQLFSDDCDSNEQFKSALDFTITLLS